MKSDLNHLIDGILDIIIGFDISKKIEAINLIKTKLHSISPFKKEPVDCVLWVKADEVVANDYNPNTVAPPEMELLKHSIECDGYTQPIVTWEKECKNEVIDGFHRNRVGKECESIKKRIHGYLPITVINKERDQRGDRIASTIRHNRARGKHQVQKMSDIVVELKNRNWTNKRIAKNLGMDEDEILRLCQITGLSELFSDKDFSKSWDIEDAEQEFDPLSDNLEDIDTSEFRTVNTGDSNRIFHTHDKWECYKAGFYATKMNGTSKEDGEQQYADFLSNTPLFESALKSLIVEWKYSCEHYLTNVSMNRIAWLGQAAVCYSKGLPAIYRGGFNLLTDEQQLEANETALIYLNKWLSDNGLEPVSLEEGLSGKQVDLY